VLAASAQSPGANRSEHPAQLKSPALGDNGLREGPQHETTRRGMGGTSVLTDEVNRLARAIGISHRLTAAGAKHVIVSTPIRTSRRTAARSRFSAGTTSRRCCCRPASPKTAPTWCSRGADETAGHLHPEHGSYAHAFQHQGNNGNRLYQVGFPDDGGTKYEPLNIGDPDVQAAFAEVTRQNTAATDVLADDGGGDYNCVPRTVTAAATRSTAAPRTRPRPARTSTPRSGATTMVRPPSNGTGIRRRPTRWARRKRT